MKCPSCGAEIGTSKVCEFCGSTITTEMQREAEQLRKEGCPKCGSSNITFRRENQGEVRGKNQKAVIHRTVGLCKDCGFTWYPNEQEAPVRKRKTWLWVLGWICIFPLPLTLILLKKKDMKPAIKYGIIAAAWLVYALIGIFGGNSEESGKASTTETGNQTSVVEEAEEVQESEGVEEPVAKYVDNETVNAFIVAYNEISDNDFTDIDDSVRRYKATAKSEGFYFTIEDLSSGLRVNIETTSETNDVSVRGMGNVFRNTVKCLDSSLSDEEIDAWFADRENEEHLYENTLGSLTINYYPDVQLSWGLDKGHISISAPK